MRINMSGALRAALVALAGSLSLPLLPVLEAPVSAQAPEKEGIQNSIMTISPKSHFPLAKKVGLGMGKSLIIQFPIDLRDVLVSDPDKVDAVVQSVDRVFLIAKKPGGTNIIFFDSQGQQIMTLDVTVGSDLSELDQLLKRLLPGSNIRTELAGSAVVLQGSVRSVLDSTRAADITTQFALSNRNLTNGWSAVSTTTGGVTTTQVTGTNGRTSDAPKPIINLLTIEGEDQVMLKVTVAEVQRSVLKQFGINLASSFSVAGFGVNLATANAFPVTGAALGQLPDRKSVV